MTSKKNIKVKCILCSKESEPYPIHIGCYEILEVYNRLLRIYQELYPRGWIDFLNLRTRAAADQEPNNALKEIIQDIAKAGEMHRELLDNDFWKKHWPEHERTKK